MNVPWAPPEQEVYFPRVALAMKVPWAPQNRKFICPRVTLEMKVPWAPEPPRKKLFFLGGLPGKVGPLGHREIQKKDYLGGGNPVASRRRTISETKIPGKSWK